MDAINHLAVVDLHAKFPVIALPPSTGPNSFVFTYIFTEKHPLTLVDPGDTTGERSPPDRIQFFCFRICFCRKAPISEVGPPPQMARHPPPNGKSWINHWLRRSTPSLTGPCPPREILDPPLLAVAIECSNYCDRPLTYWPVTLP